MVHSVYISVVLDTRKQLKDGKYPVKLRLTHHRNQKYYTIGMSLFKEEFDKATASRPRGVYKELSTQHNNIEQLARDIIADMPLFSFAEFERKLKGFTRKSDDVLSMFEEYMDELLREDRISTESNYRVTYNSMRKFMKRKKSLPFHELGIDWLRDYEKWLLNDGKSITTVGIYCRCIRAIYNLGIEKGVASKDYYPFGKRRYQIPDSKNVKKALSLQEIKMIMDYECRSDNNEERSRDYWIFVYLCNGINIKDMSYLKWDCIEDGLITFYRTKTRNTKKANLKPIIAVLTEEIQSIIDRWGTTPKSSPFVFPILDAKDDVVTIEKKVQQIIRTTNRFMRIIGKELGITKPVTTYVARHSYATVLKRSGAPIQFISEALGHSNLKTTESYLDSFEQKTRLEYAKKLTDFSSLNQAD